MSTKGVFRLFFGLNTDSERQSAAQACRSFTLTPDARILEIVNYVCYILVHGPIDSHAKTEAFMG